MSSSLASESNACGLPLCSVISNKRLLANTQVWRNKLTRGKMLEYFESHLKLLLLDTKVPVSTAYEKVVAGGVEGSATHSAIPTLALTKLTQEAPMN